jgi:hypothetical protein
MCAVSAISDYGQGVVFTQDSFAEFKKLMEAAKIFDEKTNQPDCEDPEKQKWIEVVERQVKE